MAPEALAAYGIPGRTVLVTGSCQGLGATIAEFCADAGAAGVVLTGLPADAGKAEQVLQRLRGRAMPKGCTFVPCDLADAKQTTELFATAVARMGHIDCLVNSAAFNPRANLEGTSVPLFDKIYAINLRAPFLLTQALARHVRQRRADAVAAGQTEKPWERLLPHGAVVNISSVQAFGGLTHSVAYASLKSALVVMSKNTAHELRGDRIRVNAVLPGWMPTAGECELQQALGAGSEWVRNADAGAPLGRLCRAEDCAYAVLYLLSRASEMVTGTALQVHPEMVLGMLPQGTGDGNNPQKESTAKL
eukprot:TRINITY_DN11269_c0_g1_i1.p2 TRINITY_DN11269_c0_g1~~TRINITY_DN11269_c0_g1_i1.p2  ORF type:complete len:305 (+),score=104.09 TRINITY_DN11269_c0_g1_i1:86-1000(+)